MAFILVRRLLVNKKIYKEIVIRSDTSRRYKLTTAAINVNTENLSKPNGVASSSSPLPPDQPDQLDLSFTSTRDAYKSKTTGEIIRALLVLKLSSYNFLVENHEQLMKIGKKILGPTLFRAVMKNLFFKHFVAGENTEAIKPVIARLESFGVKSILDYSAEEDLTEEEAVKVEIQSFQPKNDPVKDDLQQYKLQKEFADRRKYKPTARTYFYLNEASCEKNMETFLKCIDAVATTAHTGFAAVKLTALGRPQLLLQLSEVIIRTRMFFQEVTGETKIISMTPEEFKLKLDTRFHITTENEEVKKWFDKMDTDRRGLMNLFSWNGLIDTSHLINEVFFVPNLQSGKLEKIISALTREEEEMFRNMMRRIHHIAAHAQKRDVRVMIDAEQSYLQPAINRITMELMRKYNKEKAIVFNTYQCYLKNTFNNVLIDLELARRQGFYFGAKLVRGAYMHQERARAKEVGYEDPVNPSFEATTEMYHKTLSEFMNQIVDIGIDSKKLAIMVASHNEDTVRFTVQKMRELGIKPSHKVICFGQLLGMCDHVSFPLGQSGYSVYKYVPYGPVDEVIPYLSRRAAENNGVLKKVKKERKLLMKELLRRIVNGDVLHDPVKYGKYKPI